MPDTSQTHQNTENTKALIAKTGPDNVLHILHIFQSLNSEFPLQYAVCLLEIALNEGISLTELANKAGMALSTVSRIVGALSTDRQKGLPYQLVEARIDPTNRRRKSLHLTKQGRTFIKKFTKN